MWKRIALILYLFIGVPVMVQSYVTLKTWTAYEILTAPHLNSNFTLINAGLDSVLADVRDSTFAHQSDIRDTAAVIISDSSLAHLADIRDTATVMFQDSLFAHLSDIRDTTSVILQDSLFAHLTDITDSIYSHQKFILSYYTVDDTNPPALIAVEGRDCAAFASDSTQIIYFTIPLDNFNNFSTDKGIYITYAMSSANGDSVAIDIDYTVYKTGVLMSSASTNTDTLVVNPNDAAKIMELSSALTIANGDIDNSTNRIEVTLERLHSHAEDKHTGHFYLFDVLVK